VNAGDKGPRIAGSSMEESMLMENCIAVWEGEGGSPCLSRFRVPHQAAPHSKSSPEARPVAGELTGTVNQIEWAVQIKERVSAEFDRVARALNSVAGEQGPQDRLDTQAILAILEEKRAEVMARTQAGYFIHDWQELSDQVRQMIVQDPRYLTIKNSKTARRRDNGSAPTDLHIPQKAVDPSGRRS
jgi:hypothetical protein